MLALVLLTLLCAQGAVHAQDEGYTRQIQEVLETVDRARAADGAARTAEVNSALQSLREIGEVQTAAGDVRPYLGHVEHVLSATPPDLDRAARLLRELLAQLGDETVKPADPAQEAALREVLADERFGPEPPPGWLERTLNSIRDWFGRLFSRFNLGGAGEGPLSIVRVLLVVLSVTLVGFALLLLLRAWRGRTSRGAPDTVVSDARGTATSGTLLAQADSYARAGDYRSAVRANFLSLLLWLHERGRLAYEASLTNREHLTKIGQGTPLATALAPVVRVFDDVWYGDLPIDDAGYQAFQQRTYELRTDDRALVGSTR